MNQDKPENINNHVVAVIDTEAAAAAVAADLQRQGYSKASLFQGEDVADKLDPKGEHSGPVAKIFKAVEDHLSEETNYLAQYQEEARAGHDVVAVPVEDKEQADAVQAILTRHGGRNVRFFGRLAVTDMTPESNPSRPSEASPEVQAKQA